MWSCTGVISSACESFSRKSCTTTAYKMARRKLVDERTKTWTEKKRANGMECAQMNANSFIHQHQVMLDIIPSPQGRLLLTRSALCCVSKVTACKWQSCIRHRTLTLIYKVCFYLAWFTPRLFVIIYFNDGWMGVGRFAGKAGKVELFSARKKKVS